LRQELGRIDRKESIAIGTATDPYQPAERRFGRTRAILEVFARERGRRVSITTKSDLVVRDLDLLREIARANVLAVNLTVTTLDETLARALEPRAPRPELRLQAIRRMSASGICVGLYPNPVMPGLTDSERSLDRLARAARDAGAMTFGGGPLFLKPSAKNVMLPFLEREIPELAARYRELYASHAYLGKVYKDALAARLRRVRERYGLASGMIEYRPELWEGEEQGELFPLH
jgi:DNA repair photolyase